MCQGGYMRLMGGEQNRSVPDVRYERSDTTMVLA
jgi:hypothetical protein